MACDFFDLYANIGCLKHPHIFKLQKPTCRLMLLHLTHKIQVNKLSASVSAFLPALHPSCLNGSFRSASRLYHGNKLPIKLDLATIVMTDGLYLVFMETTKWRATNCFLTILIIPSILSNAENSPQYFQFNKFNLLLGSNSISFSRLTLTACFNTWTSWDFTALHLWTYYKQESDLFVCWNA